jgi:spermidine synthase
MLLMVLAVSGFCSLLYEVSWIRMLGLRLGTSPMAVSTVLTAFFLGMAVGSLAADLPVSRIRRKAWLLGALQILTGMSGLIVTHQLSSPHTLVGSFLESSAPWMRSSAAFAVMLPATACIGAILPVGIAVARTTKVSLARLYAGNNIGAAAGSLAAGFILLPAMGYTRAVLAGAVVMLLSGAALCLFARETPYRDPVVHDRFPDETVPAPRAPFVLLLVLTGFGSTSLQVVLIRYFALLLDSTIYSLSAVMAAHLVGFSLGSWILSFSDKRSFGGVRSLSMWLVLLGLSILLIPGFLTFLPRLCSATASFHDSSQYAALAAVGFPVAILIPTMLFGRIFPLALRGGRAAYGQLCGANMLGAAAASMLTGTFLIPYVGSGQLLKGIGVAYCLASLLFVGLAPWPRKQAVRWALVAAAIVIGGCLPGLDYTRIRTTLRDEYRTSDGEMAVPKVLYFREGRVSNVSVVTLDGSSAWLETDGLKEARIDLTRSGVRGATEMLLGLVPYLTADSPESALVLGYGAGTTAELLARTNLGRISVVEIEPLVVEAVGQVRPEWTKDLREGRIRIEYEDARHLLVSQGQQYDIIASQPSHPWRVGSGNFFTREFFELARTRLRPGGVYAQWLNLFRIEAPTVESTLRAFYEVFPHALLMSNPATEDVILIGSAGEMTFDLRKMTATLSDPSLEEMLGTQGIRSPEDLLWYFESGRAAFAGGVRPNTDATVLTEFRRRALSDGPDSHALAQSVLSAGTICDVSQFLRATDREEALFRLGQRLVAKRKWGNDDRGHAIAECLGKLNERTGQALKEELLARRGGN